MSAPSLEDDLKAMEKICASLNKKPIDSDNVLKEILNLSQVSVNELFKYCMNRRRSALNPKRAKKLMEEYPKRVVQIYNQYGSFNPHYNIEKNIFNFRELVWKSGKKLKVDKAFDAKKFTNQEELDNYVYRNFTIKHKYGLYKDNPKLDLVIFILSNLPPFIGGTSLTEYRKNHTLSRKKSLT